KQWNKSPSVSQDGKMLAASLNTGDLVLIDTTTSQNLRTLVGHKEPPTTTAFSPDGTKLFSAGGKMEPRVLIWDVVTGKLLHEPESLAFPVDNFAVSPNGRWLASAVSKPKEQADR